MATNKMHLAAAAGNTLEAPAPKRETSDDVLSAAAADARGRHVSMIAQTVRTCLDGGLAITERERTEWLGRAATELEAISKAPAQLVLTNAAEFEAALEHLQPLHAEMDAVALRQDVAYKAGNEEAALQRRYDECSDIVFAVERAVIAARPSEPRGLALQLRVFRQREDLD